MCGVAGRGPALALAGLGLMILVSGCWLSPATPQNPSGTRIARTIPLTQDPDSTLANIKEAFRVGSVQAYMRSIYTDPLPANDFLAEFAPGDLTDPPTDPATQALINGGWHSAQEQIAVGSLMNVVSSVDPDTGRAGIVRTADEGTTPEGRLWKVRYHFNVPLGSASHASGTADVTFKTNSAGEWQIVKWRDYRLDDSLTVPSWGQLRFKNRG
jgi:hypothetical protein